MRVETNFHHGTDDQRVPSFEIVLRCKNADPTDASDEKKHDGKSKRGLQLDKHRKCGNVDDEKENIVNLIARLKLKEDKGGLLSYDCLSDVISRSPMRNHDCHGGGATKPYEYPYSVSKVYGGVARVVEGSGVDPRSSPSLYRRLYTTLQSPGVVGGGGIVGVGSVEGHVVGDVDLRDINLWLNLCKRDPKLLSDFVEDCQNELSKRDMSHFYEHRPGRNACSSVSSDLTSPAQSPSERSLTSPESVTCDENSLYYCKSPTVPSLDAMTMKQHQPQQQHQPVPQHNQQQEDRVGRPSPSGHPSNHLNILPDGSLNESGATCPNIGTVMLNLVEDPYESTIDLNQFATVCDTHADASSSSSSPPSSLSSASTSSFPSTSSPAPSSSSSSPSLSGSSSSSSSTVERDALNEKLDPKAKESAWTRITQLNIDLLGKGDKEGDTQLMILLVSEKVTLEYVYVIVERLLKENAEYLSCRNELNQDALYLAAFKLIWEPLVASYIAEALVRGKQDVNKKYDGGNTILHCLAKQGDTHAKVLERLVKLRLPNRTSVFDINKKNNRGFTPLHIACEAHKKEVVHTYQTVKVLVENGADCSAKDYKDENTPLHTLINESCDPNLIRILLETRCRSSVRDDGPPPTVVPNRQGNTALHLSCGRNTLGLHHQKDVVRLLLRHGAMIQLKNINGCVPSVLVDSSRKQEIKSILHSNRQKAT